jgi:MYXO-CTERM domain-containing protein
MQSKLWKIAGAAVLASSVMTMGPAMAQSGTSESANSGQSGSASAGQSTPSQFEQQRDSSGKDWGWLGLLGLLGLAGLRRRRDPELERDTTSAKRGSGAYNR